MTSKIFLCFQIIFLFLEGCGNNDNDNYIEGSGVIESTNIIVSSKVASTVLNIESKEGVIVVGEKAIVYANVLVHTAIVNGEVKGNIRAISRIELHQPAHVYGDLIAPVVIIDAGVVFHGNCNMEASDDEAIKNINVAEMET